MPTTIAMPAWVVVLLGALAALAVLDRLLVPSVRWFLRSRVNRVLEEVGQQLRIKIEPFRLTKREVLIDRLMFDPQVAQAAEEYAEREAVPWHLAMDQVGRYAREIVPAFNAYLYFRIGYWLARRLARLLYRVRLNVVDESAFEAIDRRSTVVFVMNHRSNMDYVLVAYLAATQTALSYAVGEWARVWPLQTLVRAMGGYFVRRRSNDPLYRTVLARYVQMATEAGVTQAVFPEGGLSHDGRIGAPRLGLLDYMLRSFDPTGDRDLVFVPVAINYDRVLEDRTLLMNADDVSCRPSPFPAALHTVRFALRNLGQMVLRRWYRFGYACVNFGPPISMRRYCAEHELDPCRLPREQRFEAVRRMADEMMRIVARLVPVVPVAVVAAVLREHQAPMTELELKAEAHRLMKLLQAVGAHVHIPRRDREYAIEVGLRMLTLRHMVDRRNGLLVAVDNEQAVFDYYANSIAHFLNAPTQPLSLD